MDDSLADFQETKNLKPPKKQQNGLAKSTKQPKRTSTKVKNQKDIRTALKEKRDNLINYTQEFHNVCLETGVDIDSEQLQIAIALSKSLKELENKDEPSTSKQQQTQECGSRSRSARIRSTLLEYGFNVPEIKSTVVPKKRLKKYKKPSKLLATTDEEKKQIVLGRLTEILFKFHSSAIITITEDTTSHNQTSDLYNISGASFHRIKDDKCFYTANVVEIAPNTTGCLLRDWAEIPGRPQSPKPSGFAAPHFTEYIDNQDDLDLLLSSTMEVAIKLVKTEKEINYSIEDINSADNNYNDVDEQAVNTDYSENIDNNFVKMDVPNVRFSPDIFDDNPSINYSLGASKDVKSEFINLVKSPVHATSMSNHTNVKSQSFVKIKNHNDYMDLTECVNDINYLVHNKLNETDPIQSQNQTTQTVLAKSPSFTESETYTASQNYSSQTFDLTQSSDTSSDSLPRVKISQHVDFTAFDKLSQDDALNNDAQITLARIDNTDFEHQINTTNRNKGDNLDCTDVTGEFKATKILTPNRFQLSTEKSSVFSDFILKDSSNFNKEVISLHNVQVKETKDIIVEPTDSIQNDMQLSNSSESVQAKFLGEERSICDTDGGVITGGISLDSINNLFRSSEHQRGNEDRITHTNISKCGDKMDQSHGFCAYHNLNDFPIDVDVETGSPNLNLSPENKASSMHFPKPKFEDEILSQCPANFSEIHKEFDYSMQYYRNKKLQKSICTINGINDNYNLGSGSILRCIESIPSTSNCVTPTRSILLRRSKSLTLDGSLPAVEIKGTKVNIKSPLVKRSPSTPCTLIKMSEGSTTVTPGNTEYIFKTDNVTPMMDYASLETPKVNKELEKFGIKPFKRKRAVQLLEHLYYQTHPIVEYLNHDSPESEIKKSKIQKPKEPLSSQNALSELDDDEMENNIDDSKENSSIYDGDNFNPVIKSLPCSEEDWIFQRKEKSKIQGCRVPLHIAFHNYISARTSLREAILRYEPISIDIVHKQLAKDGHRYDPKDVLKYMDKKCITVKTAENKNGEKRTKRKI